MSPDDVAEVARLRLRATELVKLTDAATTHAERLDAAGRLLWVRERIHELESAEVKAWRIESATDEP